MHKLDVYLYGMTVWSTIHLLEGDYPEADTYGEISDTHVIPGGETGNSAVVLANLGLKVKIDGPYLGQKTKDGIQQFYGSRGIDCSGMHYDPSFAGVQDLVLVGGHSRTVFGSFGHYFRGEKRWSRPDENAIQTAAIVSLDPYFGDESNMVMEACRKAGKRYVTIDCPPESEMHQYAAATVVSNEYIRNNFPSEDMESLYKRYTEATNGLVIFTFGSREIVFGRKGGSMEKIKPYQVEVKSTLGAGDTFRGGVVYGLLKGMEDAQTVRFAAALAACVCKRFPMALNPPTLEEINALMRGVK